MPEAGEPATTASWCCHPSATTSSVADDRPALVASEPAVATSGSARSEATSPLEPWHTPSVVHVDRTNTILYCARWRDAVEFYRDRLGLEVSFENDWFVELRLGPASFVSVADAARSSTPTGSGAGLTLSWRVADVDRARAELIEAGVDVSDVGSRWGARVLDLFDPEGNRVELWSDPARS